MRRVLFVLAALLGASPAASSQKADPLAGLRPTYGAATARALAHLRARRPAAALAALGEPGDAAGRLARARALFSMGRFAEAAPAFLGLSAEEPLLADLFRAWAARALLNAGDAAAAAREADAVTEDTSALPGAVLSAAEAHLAAGRPRQARARAKRFVDAWPEKAQAAAALWILAQAARQMGDVRAARAAERRIRIEYPVSSHADRVGEIALRPGEAIERAERLVKAHRNEVASRELRAVLAAGRLSRAERCRATYLLGAALQRRRRHREAFASLRTAARICGDGDLAARALYLWGKGLSGGRRAAAAARVLERLARRFPRHRLADDALLLAAQGWRRAGDLARARRALERLLRDMPRGDMAPRARFEMARLAARMGNLEEAARRLAAIADEEPYPPDGHLRGRPLYALGRLRERQGNRDAALQAYRRCAALHPLTYWAALARGRLRAAGEELRDGSRDALPSETSPGALPWPPLPPALATSKAFARGAALVRLGAGDLAAPEMARASQEAGRTEEVQTALSLIYHLAGDWHRSHWIIRRRLGHLLARPPTPESWRLFLLAYPLGFREVVEPLARRFRVDPLLLTALVREESAFNPTIESWANAVGLSQLIWPTAQRIARALRIRPLRREMLLDPEINLRIGATYLANLLRRFRGSPPLAIAGYNAGERSVDRWLRERGDAPLDRFVDAIPYEQTRHYTRRVMESYATYKYIYGMPGERLLALGPGRAQVASR